MYSKISHFILMYLQLSKSITSIKWPAALDCILTKCWIKSLDWPDWGCSQKFFDLGFEFFLYWHQKSLVSVGFDSYKRRILPGLGVKTLFFWKTNTSVTKIALIRKDIQKMSMIQPPLGKDLDPLNIHSTITIRFWSIQFSVKIMNFFK